MEYCKIPKISLGAYIFQRPFLRSLYSEGLIYRGKFAFQNRDWASLIVGSKFNVFALFYFAFESNFPSTSPWRAYIWRGDLTGFLHYRLGGLIFGGVYAWKGLFSEFYDIRKWVLKMSIRGVYNYCAIEWNIYSLHIIIIQPYSCSGLFCT